MARKMIRNLAFAALVAMTAMMVCPAAAQSTFSCADHSKIVAFLGLHYSETLQAVGLINDAAILEVYASETGSWTMLVTNTSGHSCVVFAGESWETHTIDPGVKT